MQRTPKIVALKEFRINPGPTLAALEPGNPIVVLRKDRAAFVMVTVTEWNAMIDELRELRQCRKVHDTSAVETKNDSR